MLTLRCTQLVRTRLGLPTVLPDPSPSTGRLGDWYVHRVRFGRPEFVIATNERSLLTVLFPARDFRTTLEKNLCATLAGLLEALQVPSAIIEQEIASMTPVGFARATNRRVLGSLNELAFHAATRWAHGEDLATICHYLAKIPMSALGEKPGHYGYPHEVGYDLLTSSRN